MSNRRCAGIFVLPLAALLAALTPAAYAEPAVTARATPLQAQPQSDAATLAALPEQAKVDVIRRSGAWSEVKTAAGQTGWVRMLALRMAGDGGAPVAGQASGNPLAALNTVLTSGRTSSKATVTTGVRGLSEEDLQNAQANPGELQKLQKFTADAGTAQAFAQRSKLAPAQIDYLPEPARASTQVEERRRGEQ